MVVFLTNYLNPHQLPFALEMHNLLGEQFLFISMSRITDMRLKLGFEELDSKYAFVLKAYENDEKFQKSISIVDDCEILIAGSVEDKYLIPRLKKGKITLRYSERYFRKGYNIKSFLSAMKHLFPFQKYKSLYYLCSSAYTPADLTRYTHFKNPFFRWGYFPGVVRYLNADEILTNKMPNSILWCSRMVELKHPEVAIEVARRLRRDGISFTLTMIGDGEMKQSIDEMINNSGLDECVRLLGSLPPESVRHEMEKNEVFIFTSDKREGWGAVLNESMNSLCSVVASHEIGAVPFLVKSYENGIIYEDGNVDELYSAVKMLLTDKETRERIAYAAYESMISLWNGEVAARRLVELITAIKKEESISLFSDGPCSIAPVLKDNWYDNRSSMRG